MVCFKSVALAAFSHPVDIVYLWVDGNDPEWKAIKAMHQSNHKAKDPLDKQGWAPSRFADHEELRYSLRSILKFAPFFNHIYIVTMNQKPHWLLDHPKITIVDHAEIFKNPEDLPTFNSQAIESNIYRIPNLSEHFIYFNDDVFLGQPVAVSDFFSLEGKVKVLFEQGLSPSGPPLIRESLYRRAWRNTNAVLDDYYKKEARPRLCHSAFALRKSFIEEAEKEHPFVFQSNSSHKFREVNDYNITNGFLQYLWMYKEKAEIGSMSNIMITLYNEKFSYNRKTLSLMDLKNIHHHTFCLQDEIKGKKPSIIREQMRQFLEERFPDSAPWV